MSSNATHSEISRIGAPVPMERHRFHLLDALRGIAAILVVNIHTPPFFKQSLGFSDSFLAVDFFFCLSGFVIAFSYEQRLRESLGVRDFFVLRVIRLYPLYALGILIEGLRQSPLVQLHAHAQSWATLGVLFALSAFLIPNFVVPLGGNALFPLDYPAWSLFFELVINLAYAWFVPRVRRTSILVVFCLASLAALFLLVAGRPTLNFGVELAGLPVGLARVAFSFSAGVLLFRIFRSKPLNRLHGPKSWIVSGGIVLLLIAALAQKTPAANGGLRQLLLVAFLFPVLVYAGARCTLPHAANRVCAFLGDMSYPLYMLHAPLMLPAYAAHAPAAAFVHHPWLRPYVTVAYIFFLVVLAWWLGRFYDLPIRRRLTAAYKSFLARGRVTRAT